MSIDFEPLRLEHIGRGGDEDDMPLVEQIEEALREAATACADPLRSGSATITVAVKLNRREDGGITVAGSVKTSMPTRKTKALTAYVEDGEVTTATRRQQALPGTGLGAAIRPIRAGGER